MASPPNREKHTIPRWDQQLRAAKNLGRQVKFQLNIEAYFADDDCCVIGTIEETDNGGIKIKHAETGKEHWISKAHIVGTEVLDAD